jgi:hypothetical protein
VAVAATRARRRQRLVAFERWPGGAGPARLIDLARRVSRPSASGLRRQRRFPWD